MRRSAIEAGIINDIYIEWIKGNPHLTINAISKELNISYHHVNRLVNENNLTVARQRKERTKTVKKKSKIIFNVHERYNWMI